MGFCVWVLGYLHAARNRDIAGGGSRCTGCFLNPSLNAPVNMPPAQAERLEAQWPQSAAALLLALAADSPRFEAPLFETGLAECKFNEYPIDTWSKATLAVWGVFKSYIQGFEQGVCEFPIDTCGAGPPGGVGP